jgi:cold shock CspA family protein
MGRSQESFNKRENEKKRQKKKKDKLQKKEERKASPDKGSFDDMIAYVDEFGNITDTPPDPKDKKKVKKEDIEIAVPRQAPPNPEDLIRKGKVAFFNSSKGYGFIRDKDTQESIFVHVNGLTEEIQEGDNVTFETEKGPKGLNAINVKRV